MDTGILEVLGIGIPAVLIGLLALMLMVHRELGPFAGLGVGGKWMLFAAFGMGILAFGVKMAVAVTISKMPESVIAPLVAAYPKGRQSDRENSAGVINQATPRPGHYRWEALPEVAPVPVDNPGTQEKIALGKRLFFETRLSGDGTLSCSSCHNLFAKGGADGRPTAIGIREQRGARNTPTVWNAAFQSVLFWDGRSPSLEEQAKGPILNEIEMGLPSAGEAERRLSALPSYRADFASAFGDDGAVTFDRIAKALAAYERTLITPDTPYDRFVRGDPRALTQAQLRGMALFESVGCIVCHRGPNFSDASLLGGQNPLRFFPANASPYEHKYKLLTDGGGRGIWRVASLRNVALTGPWLHNGSVDKLEEVVRIMASAQLGVSGKVMAGLDQEGALVKVGAPLLSDRDVDDIVQFLNALSSESLLSRMAKKER